MKYKDQIRNSKLNSFIQINICKKCGSRIASKGIVGFNGGNIDFCYSCNVNKGLIK